MLSATMPDGRIRFLSAVRYLAKHGVFPRPVIAITAPDGLRVLDGNHRVAALFYCRAKADVVLQKGGVVPAEQQTVWVGIHAAGEQSYN